MSGIGEQTFAHGNAAVFALETKSCLDATMDVGDWLRSLGLGQYEAAFRENAIDGKVLPKLTAEDLKDLGVVIVGHRRMMLSAIEALSARSEAPAERAERAVPLPQAPPTTPSAA